LAASIRVADVLLGVATSRDVALPLTVEDCPIESRNGIESSMHNVTLGEARLQVTHMHPEPNVGPLHEASIEAWWDRLSMLFMVTLAISVATIGDGQIVDDQGMVGSHNGDARQLPLE